MFPRSRKLWVAAFAGGCLFLVILLRWAVQPAPAVQSQAKEAAIGGSDPDMTQALLVFAFVLILLAGFAWLAKKLQQKGFTAGDGTQRMQIIQNMGLSGKHRIVLVRVADRELLLGVTDQQITRLAEFDSPVEDMPDAEPRTASSQITSSRFSSYLQPFLQS